MYRWFRTIRFTELVIPREKGSPLWAYGDLACDREGRGEHQATGEEQNRFAPSGVEEPNPTPGEDRNFSGAHNLSSPHRLLGSQLSTWLGRTSDIALSLMWSCFRPCPQHFLAIARPWDHCRRLSPLGFKQWSLFAPLPHLSREHTFLGFFQNSIWCIKTTNLKFSHLSWGVDLSSPYQMLNVS